MKSIPRPPDQLYSAQTYQGRIYVARKACTLSGIPAIPDVNSYAPADIFHQQFCATALEIGPMGTDMEDYYPTHCGEDTMLALARVWAERWELEDPEEWIRVLPGRPSIDQLPFGGSTVAPSDDFTGFTCLEDLLEFHTIWRAWNRHLSGRCPPCQATKYALTHEKAVKWWEESLNDVDRMEFTIMLYLGGLPGGAYSHAYGPGTVQYVLEKARREVGVGRELYPISE